MAQAVGVGYTPEGLDQNPAFYELLQEAAFKAAPETDVTAWLVRRAHRRYGLNGGDEDVTQAWAELAASGYANDAPVDDTTNVGMASHACSCDSPSVLFRSNPAANRTGRLHKRTRICIGWRESVRLRGWRRRRQRWS